MSPESITLSLLSVGIVLVLAAGALYGLRGTSLEPTWIPWRVASDQELVYFNQVEAGFYITGKPVPSAKLARGMVASAWYLRAKAHKHRYILPYVKGPQDEPLKPATRQLFVVKR